MAQRLIVLFRNDLRLHDNVLLATAAERIRKRLSDEVLPLFCFEARDFDANRLEYDQPLYGAPKIGVRRAAFLLESVLELKRNLRAVRSDLLIETGKTEDVIARYASPHGTLVIAQEDPTPEEANLADAIHAKLKGFGELELHWGSTVFHIDDLPFEENLRDFPTNVAPFLHRVVERIHLDLICNVRSLYGDVQSGSLPLPRDPEIQKALQFTPTLTDLPFHPTVQVVHPEPHPLASFHFKGGESEGLERLRSYVWEKGGLDSFINRRHEMYGSSFSSKLSPWLATGCLSPRRVWKEVNVYEKRRRITQSTSDMRYALGYRDWTKFIAQKYGTQIFSRTGLLRRAGTARFHGSKNAEILERWKTGQTGVPFVDAIMRELKETGYIASQGRIVAANFYATDLRMDWRLGAAHYESNLIDYDVCSNWVNWLIAANLFNDKNVHLHVIRESSEIDPDGSYIRRWVPEVRSLPNRWIHQPWAAPADVLYGHRLKTQYPEPIQGNYLR